MSTIPSHHWLELSETGVQARSDRLLRPEERELIGALQAAPLRVVDLFRRLRVTDSQQFHSLLSRASGRGWFSVHEVRPNAAQVLVVEQDAPLPSPEDALGALLARYATEEAVISDEIGVIVPEWEQPIVPTPEASPSDAPDDQTEVQEGTNDQESEGALPREEPISELPVPARPVSHEPLFVEVPKEGADALFAAMGFEGEVKAWEPQSPDPRSYSDSDSNTDEGNNALLEALAHAASSQRSSSGVQVPEYGLAPSEEEEDKDSSFVRLMDIGGVFGETSSGSSGSSDTPSPVEKRRERARRQEPEEVTTRSRRRNDARQRILVAARREQAEREAARERAERFKAEKAAADEKRRIQLQEQRAQEQAQEGNSFRSRIEKARRLKEKGRVKDD